MSKRLKIFYQMIIIILFSFVFGVSQTRAAPSGNFSLNEVPDLNFYLQGDAKASATDSANAEIKDKIKISDTRLGTRNGWHLTLNSEIPKMLVSNLPLPVSSLDFKVNKILGVNLRYSGTDSINDIINKSPTILSLASIPKEEPVNTTTVGNIEINKDKMFAALNLTVQAIEVPEGKYISKLNYTMIDDIVDPPQYEIFFKDSDGITPLNVMVGGITASSFLVDEGGSLSPTSPPPKTNYIFSDWVTAAGGDTSFIFNNIQESKTAYAKWLQTVTLDRQGTTTGSASFNASLHSATKEGYEKPTRSGYTFGGYYTGVGGTGNQVITADGAYVNSANGLVSAGKWINTGVAPTLYAKWTQSVALINQITTDSNLSVTYNAIPSKTTIPIHAAYTFAGYYTEVGGGGSQVFNASGEINASVSGYTDGSKKWIRNGTTTLYAKWTQTVTLNENYVGAPQPRSFTATYNSAILTNYSNPLRSGYSFIGYFSESSCINQIITADSKFAPNVIGYTDQDGKWIKLDATTLYADWTTNPFTIHVKKDGGAWSSHGLNLTLKNAKGTYSPAAGDDSADVIFSAVPDGTYDIYSGTKELIKSISVSKGGSYTLENSTVTLHNKGIGANSSFIATKGANLAATNFSSPLRNGYDFKGYYSDFDGAPLGEQVITESPSVYKANTTYTDQDAKWKITSATTLYGYFTGHSYTIAYDGNNHDAGNPPSNVTKVYGTTENHATNSGNLIKVGYSFNGWNTLADGNGTPIVANSSIDDATMYPGKDKTKTVFASWKTESDITATFKMNDGTNNNHTTSIVQYNGLVPKPSNPTRAGYTFDKWVTTATGDTAFEFTNTRLTANTVIYAKWQPNYDDLTYWAKVVYLGNGNTGGNVPNTQYFVGDTEGTLATNSGNLTQTGFTFEGWNSNSSGTGIDYAAGGKATLAAGEHKLYAKWSALPVVGDNYEFADTDWRILAIEGKYALILKLNALTYEDLGSFDEVGRGVIYMSFSAGHSSQFFYNYLGQNVYYIGIYDKIEQYYYRRIAPHSDVERVLPVNLHAPDFATFESYQIDGALGGHSDLIPVIENTTGVGPDNWQWYDDPNAYGTRYYKDRRFATTYRTTEGDSSYYKQAFALSFGDINKYVNTTFTWSTLLGHGDGALPTPNSFWLRSPGPDYLRAGLVLDGNFGLTSSTNDNLVIGTSKPIRPALWIKLE